MKNVNLKPYSGKVAFRKVAMGTWDTPMDPSVYGFAEVDMTEALKLIESYKEKHNLKISPVHLVAKAVAYCVKKRPEINSLIRFNKIYLRPSVRIFFQVNVPGKGPDGVSKAELSGATIDNVEDKSLLEIMDELKQKAGKIRDGQDKSFKKSINLIKLIPWSLTKAYLNFSSFLLYTLNLDLSFLGFPKDPFGSAMITNVGSLGIDCALAPLCAYTRTPLLLTTGAIQDKPWIVDGEIKIRPIMNIGITFDHRLIDGVHAAEMLGEFKKCFAEPEKYLV